jgi:hypothetical protein
VTRAAPEGRRVRRCGRGYHGPFGRNKSGITASGGGTAADWPVLPRSRQADWSSSGCPRSSLAGPEKRIWPPSMMWAWLARPRATVANCSISSTPVPDSAMVRMTGISRLTTVEAEPDNPYRVTALAVAPDGSWLAFGGWDGVWMWDVTPSRKELPGLATARS